MIEGRLIVHLNDWVCIHNRVKFDAQGRSVNSDEEFLKDEETHSGVSGGVPNLLRGQGTTPIGYTEAEIFGNGIACTRDPITLWASGLGICNAGDDYAIKFLYPSILHTYRLVVSAK